MYTMEGEYCAECAEYAGRYNDLVVFEPDSALDINICKQCLKKALKMLEE